MVNEPSNSNDSPLKQLHGRSMDGTGTYQLPVDKPERERLDAQHRMWRRLLGGLYPAEVDGLIRQLVERADPSVTPLIMDVGSGSGIWAVEAASQFPQAKLLGLDLVESRPASIPSNCSFITKDVLCGLPEYAGKVDVVHARSVISHLLDSDPFIRTAYNCLKPGGLLILGDGNPVIYGAGGEEIEPALLDVGTDNTNKSWMALLMCHYLSAMENRLGPRTIMGRTQEDLMAKEPRFQILGKKTFFDLLNCPEGDKDLSKSSGAAFATAVKPAVLGAGALSPDAVETIIQNIYLEVVGPMKIFSRWDSIWAIKT